MQSLPARIVICLSLLLSLAGISLAAPVKLSSPLGLAVDSTGQLYVANFGGNNILVYNVSYGQVASKRITANISAPTGVAFEPTGNLRVANFGNSTVTEYTSIERG